MARRVLVLIKGKPTIAVLKKPESGGDQTIDALTRSSFSDENENESFLSNYPSDRAYPHFYVLEHDGTFLHSQGTGELGQGTGYNEQVFADFLDHWKPR